jgi:hypothetical protein
MKHDYFVGRCSSYLKRSKPLLLFLCLAKAFTYL